MAGRDNGARGACRLALAASIGQGEAARKQREVGHDSSARGQPRYVYDAWATGEPDGAKGLIEGLREIHPDIPVVLSASGIEPDWIEIAGPHGITPLVGAPSGPRLTAAVEQAFLAGRPEEGSFVQA